MYKVESGTTLRVSETFADDFGNEYIPVSTPQVKLMEGTDLIVQVAAIPGTVRGEWMADVPIPKMDNEEPITMKISWLFVNQEDGSKIRSTQQVTVEPSVDARVGDIVVLYGSPYFSFTLPFRYRSTEHIQFSVFSDNDPLYVADITDSSMVTVSANVETANIKLPASLPQAQMNPYTLIIERHTKSTAIPENYVFKVWAITPSVLSAASELLDFVDKARVANVIPELQYSQSDLLTAMRGGLNIFNGLPPTPSSFTGMNMKGCILESWIICSAIKLLNMQILAEGSLAFEFSGQTVSLNVDRTQSLESMLGRMQEMFESIVKPAKALLAKNGVLSGDGSRGDKVSGLGRNFGVTTVINAPTTRILRPSINGYNGRFRNYW
jgi:hypothetical protein